MSSRQASHHALPDGFADRLERLADRVEQIALCTEPFDRARDGNAVANVMRGLARFPDP